MSSLFILLLLVTFTLFHSTADASDNNSSDNDWNTAYVVGRFLNSDPPTPDQIFKIQYRVINGTIDSFNMLQEIDDVLMHNTIITDVKSSDNGRLEIMFPRNFPYTNSAGDSEDTGHSGFYVDNEAGSIEADSIATKCFFVFSIPFAGSNEIEIGMASILIKSPYRGDNVPENCIRQTIVEDVPTKADGTIRPLNQIAAGVSVNDVLCPEAFQLVVSPGDKPYCATPTSGEILRERWQL